MIIDIEYCVPCGYLDRALEAQRAILNTFGRSIDGVTLRTGHKGVFTFKAGDEVIYSKPDTFDITTIIEAIKSRLPEPEGVQTEGRDLLMGKQH